MLSSMRSAVANKMQIKANIILTPGIMIAGSDSKHFSKVSDDSYRFNPMLVTQKDLATFHGTDEQISIENLALATKTYTRIIINGSAE